MKGGTKTQKVILATVITVILSLNQCAPRYQQRLKKDLKETSQIKEIDKKSPYLKIHMLNGQLYILSGWRVEEGNESVTGSGQLLDFNRKPVDRGSFTIPLSQVALFETNVLESSKAVLAMTMLTVPSFLLTAYCIANPKACFGSCPTFYAWDGEKMIVQAEGFSSSVCPALEATDIDALYRAKPRNQDFEVRVTNEAFETHVIRFANILAVPRDQKSRVFTSLEGTFWQARTVYEPKKCTAQEGDCLDAVQYYDALERFSRADAHDLAQSETIDIEFDGISKGQFGFFVGYRQTLLTTFLFYQGLAYMGDSAGHLLAELERGDNQTFEYANSIGDVLGGIKVFVEDGDNNWILAGEIRETGPIATDIRMVLLPEINNPPNKIRLQMTQGLWRIDYIGLAELISQVEPIRIEPSAVFREGRNDETAKKDLLSPCDALVTMPGDELTLIYSLPDSSEFYELFLESRGYYIEWMRPSWFKEKNLFKTLMMFKEPEKYLKVMAPEFKRIESQMEDVFWRSKYVRREQ